jgi:predicted ATPase
LLGELLPARGHLEQGIALYDLQQHRTLAFRYGSDPGVLCLSFAAWTLWLLGYPDQAYQRNNEALALAQEVSHPYSLAFALAWAAEFHHFCREEQAGQGRAEAVVALSAEQGFPGTLAIGTILRGWALAARGQAEEGSAQMRQGLAAYRAAWAEVHRPYFLGLLAEVCGKVGQLEEGFTALTEALAAVNKTEERIWEAELYRLKGELTLAQSSVLSLASSVQQEAEACFLKAIEIARHQSAKSLELRATVSLSRLWQHKGKKAEARQMLAEVYNWFTEGFDTKDLQEAKALLDHLTQESVKP